MAVALRLGRRNLARPILTRRLARWWCGRTAPSLEIVGRGWTAVGGRPHAETIALEQAGEAARGATVYVTLEPCSHDGETPPCAQVLIHAGVARVVSALEDPDKRVAGRDTGCWSRPVSP